MNSHKNLQTFKHLCKNKKKTSIYFLYYIKKKKKSENYQE